MKVTMVSNFYNAHQHTVASQLYDQLGPHYSFVETTDMNTEQKNLGYTSFDLPYIKKAYGEQKTSALEAIEQADILICGGFTDIAWQRIYSNKPTYIFSERLFVDSILPMFKPRRLFDYLKRITYFNRRSNIYYLCASSYLSFDLSRIGYKHKNMFKFGYFPPFNSSKINKRNNQTTKILWCGRMIDWKQGEHVLYMADKLNAMGLKFEVNMIGAGDYKSLYEKIIIERGITNIVTLKPAIKQTKMLDTMFDHDILIQPSNYKEGWGAVVNEAMSSGCTVVASSGVGSSNYLIEDGISGFIYKNGDIDKLTSIVKSLIDDREKCKSIGENAQKRIHELWNGKVAASRLIQVFEDVLNKKPITYYKDGPCSFAEIIKNK